MHGLDNADLHQLEAPERVIADVAAASGGCTVLSQQEVTSEEISVDGKVGGHSHTLFLALANTWLLRL